MPHIVTRHHSDQLWYWYSIGPSGEELMRSNVGRRARARVEMELRILKLLAAKPGSIIIEVSQSLRVGDWRSHLSVVGEGEYEASSTVWYVQRSDAESVGDMTVAALSQAAGHVRRRSRLRHV